MQQAHAEEVNGLMVRGVSRVPLRAAHALAASAGALALAGCASQPMSAPDPPHVCAEVRGLSPEDTEIARSYFEYRLLVEGWQLVESPHCEVVVSYSASWTESRLVPSGRTLLGRPAPAWTAWSHRATITATYRGEVVYPPQVVELRGHSSKIGLLTDVATAMMWTMTARFDMATAAR